VPSRAVPAPPAKSDHGSSSPRAAGACWGDGFLQGKASSVELGTIFGSRLSRDGCAAVLSASKAKEPLAEDANAFWVGGAGVRREVLKIIVRYY
jgi:hypothetical protein